MADENAWQPFAVEEAPSERTAQAHKRCGHLKVGLLGGIGLVICILGAALCFGEELTIEERTNEIGVSPKQETQSNDVEIIKNVQVGSTTATFPSDDGGDGDGAGGGDGEGEIDEGGDGDPDPAGGRGGGVGGVGGGGGEGGEGGGAGTGGADADAGGANGSAANSAGSNADADVQVKESADPPDDPPAPDGSGETPDGHGAEAVEGEGDVADGNANGNNAVDEKVDEPPKPPKPSWWWKFIPNWVISIGRWFKGIFGKFHSYMLQYRIYQGLANIMEKIWDVVPKDGATLYILSLIVIVACGFLWYLKPSDDEEPENLEDEPTINSFGFNLFQKLLEKEELNKSSATEEGNAAPRNVLISPASLWTSCKMADFMGNSVRDSANATTDAKVKQALGLEDYHKGRIHDKRYVSYSCLFMSKKTRECVSPKVEKDFETVFQDPIHAVDDDPDTFISKLNSNINTSLLVQASHKTPEEVDEANNKDRPSNPEDQPFKSDSLPKNGVIPVSYSHFGEDWEWQADFKKNAKDMYFQEEGNGKAEPVESMATDEAAIEYADAKELNAEVFRIPIVRGRGCPPMFATIFLPKKGSNTDEVLKKMAEVESSEHEDVTNFRKYRVAKYFKKRNNGMAPKTMSFKMPLLNCDVNWQDREELDQALNELCPLELASPKKKEIHNPYEYGNRSGRNDDFNTPYNYDDFDDDDDDYDDYPYDEPYDNNPYGGASSSNRWRSPEDDVPDMSEPPERSTRSVLHRTSLKVSAEGETKWWSNFFSCWIFHIFGQHSECEVDRPFIIAIAKCRQKFMYADILMMGKIVNPTGQKI